MKKLNPFIAVAWIFHAISWFVTAVKPLEYSGPIAGWKAFRLATCGVLHCEGVEFQTPHHAALAGASAITTVFFLCSPWLVLRGPQSLRRWSAWVTVAAFLLNIHWIVTFGDQRSALAIGYYLWLSSFLLLAVGLFASVPKASMLGRIEAPGTVLVD
jgi:hypothetical protein